MKIVCTGYGVIAPKTKNIEDYLYNLEKGICALDVVENEGPHNETNILGVIEEGLESLDGDKQMSRLPKVTKNGIIAAREAVKSAQIDLLGKKVGTFFGISLGASGEELYQNAIIHANNDMFRKVPIMATHYANYHSITVSIAQSIGAKGIVRTITTGCTSSLEAIEEAMMYLKAGKIDVAIVGGTDSPLSKATTYAFAKTRLLPLDQSLQEGAVPFQEGSKGFAMAEASGVLVLEREEHAQNRGAVIKGEVVDVMSNNDGVPIFTLETAGTQLMNALREVTAGRTPDYISSQALGIQMNDQIELQTSETLFQHKVPYTSIKSMYGNPFGTIGVLQVIASLLSIEHNFIPPTIRTNQTGYETMNLVTQTQYKEIKEVAITNHGHGGNNACAYVKEYLA